MEEFYVVRLSFNMLVAMVDIAKSYNKADSPRHRKQTKEALWNRGYVTSPDCLRLTPRGYAHLDGAIFEIHGWKKAKAA